MVLPALPPFAEIALLLALAAAIGLDGTLLRQPLIVSFIAVGLISGPSALDVVHSDAQIDLLAELGIAILLFLVGIKLDVKLIRSLGAVSLMTGLGQVAFTSVFGYLIGLALGLDHLTSVYVAVALTFSSTMFDGKAAGSSFKTRPVRLRDIAPLASPTQTNGPADSQAIFSPSSNCSTCVGSKSSSSAFAIGR